MQQHHPNELFDSLTSDQQEHIAEIAEEPAVEWLLSRNSQKNHAARVAQKIVLIIDLTKTTPHLDIISCGHKTSTEAFLTQWLGLTLREIGGSFKILDSFTLHLDELAVKNDRAQLTIRRENGEFKDFTPSLSNLRNLAQSI